MVVNVYHVENLKEVQILHTNVPLLHLRGFLSIYFALDLVWPFVAPQQRASWCPERGLLDAAAAASLLLGGLFGSWLRVALGYHSMDQVAAGTLAGSCGEVLSSTSSDRVPLLSI